MNERTVDFPKIHRNRAGVLVAKRLPRAESSETAWTAELLAARDRWLDLVGLPAVVSVDLEYRIAPLGVSASQGGLGLPRADAILWHDDERCSILEAKVTSSASHIMGGVGQLIYYATLMRKWREVNVVALVLAAPYLPPFVLDAVQEISAPIRYLKAPDDGFVGLIPPYLSHGKSHNPHS